MVGKGQNTKTKRNLELLDDIKSGNFSIVDLVKKYNITSQRIYQIKKRAETPSLK